MMIEITIQKFHKYWQIIDNSNDSTVKLLMN
jgi:hypothetical protein